MPAVYAQASPIQVDVDRRELSTDDTLTLTVTITGSSSVPSPSNSAFNEFDVVSRSSSSQISIVNGVTSAKVVYQYRLRPIRTGSVTIDPIQVVLDGQTFSSNPLSVQVTQGSSRARQVPGAPPSGPAPTRLIGQDYFVESTVDNAAPYLGEQVVYTFRIYRATGFGRARYAAPDFTGFWNKQDFEQRTSVTQVAGRTYRVTELRTVLFPTLAGPMSIEPATLTVPGGFLGPSAVLRSEPVSLEIARLPESAPADFSGAVGQFAISAGIDSTDVTVNEPLTHTVTIRGQGNIDALADPNWPEMPRWRAFDSSATINSQVSGDKLTGSRVYERVLVPGAAGEFTIPPVSYSYFDPSVAEYVTMATAPTSVSVAPGASVSPITELPGVARDTVERLSADIRHIKPVPTGLTPASRALTDRVAYWVAWAVPAVALGAAFVWRQRRQRLLVNGAAARGMQAHRDAREQLAKARAERSDPYLAAGRTLVQYIGDRISQPVSGLTRSAIASLLASRDIPPGVIERVETCLVASEGGDSRRGGTSSRLVRRCWTRPKP